MLFLGNRKMLACRPPNPTFNTVTTHESRPSLKSEYIRKIATDACLIGSLPTPHSSKIPPGLIKTRDCVPCTYTTNSGYNTLKSYPYSEYKLCECTLDLRRTRRRLACTSCSAHAKSMAPSCNSGHITGRTQRDAMAAGSGATGQVNHRVFLPRQHDLTPGRFTPPPEGVCPPAVALRLQAPVDSSILQHRSKRPMRAPSSHCNRHYHSKEPGETDDGSQARHHALRMATDSARHSYPTAYHSHHAVGMPVAQRLSQGVTTDYNQLPDRMTVSTIQEPVRLRSQAPQHHHQRHHEHCHHSHIQQQQQPQQSQDHSTKQERQLQHLLSIDQRNSLPTVMDPRNFEVYATLLNEVHIR